MTVEEATEVLADDVLCQTATDLREQLRRSILRELRLREDQQKSWRRIVTLESDLADARAEADDLRRLVIR